MAGTMPQGGPISNALGLTPQVDLETDEEKRRRQRELALASKGGGGIISNALLSSMTGGFNSNG